MNKKLTTIAFSLSIILGCSYLSSSKVFDSQPVFITSLESKTVEGFPVYNQIYYKSESNQDIWMMKQSHDGPKLAIHKWDRLAIIVNKQTHPKTALFLQLPPGELEWDDSLKSKGIEYKVSCFLCHSNGPRSIRADENSNLKFKDKLKVFFWNFKIKLYGVIVEDPLHAKLDKRLKIPFRLHSKIENEELKIQSCLNCHNADAKSGFFNRNLLTRQNLISIDFMLKNGFMPPPAHKINSKDQELLEDFLRGF